MLDPLPTIDVVAGPNGAGKSTAAPELLRATLRVDTFVNADVIARGLSAFAPESVASEAGRIMLTRLDALERARRPFAFETTLSGPGVVRRIERYAAAGFNVRLHYLWLPHVDIALQRVAERVRAGGHDVPADVVRRRFPRSLLNFDRLRRVPDVAWRLVDVSRPSSHPRIAHGRGGLLFVDDSALWRRVDEPLWALRRGGAVHEAPLPPLPYGSDDACAEAPEEQIAQAFVRARADLVRLYRQLGRNMVVWKDERVQQVSPFDVPVPGESAD